MRSEEQEPSSKKNLHDSKHKTSESNICCTTEYGRISRAKRARAISIYLFPRQYVEVGENPTINLTSASLKHTNNRYFAIPENSLFIVVSFLFLFGCPAVVVHLVSHRVVNQKLLIYLTWKFFLSTLLISAGSPFLSLLSRCTYVMAFCWLALFLLNAVPRMNECVCMDR